METRWIDTHVHLERYAPADRARMLATARVAGVQQLVAVSTSMESSRRTVALKEPVAKAVGVHPTRADDLDNDLLATLAASQGIVAIGEIGFDGSGPELSVQREVFARQAALARELDLAVLLHIDGEGAWEAFEPDAGLLDGLCVVRHYFRGDTRQLAFHAARGHYISFGRPLLRDEALQQLACEAPAQLLLIETDTYPLPGRATEPKDLVPVGELVAELRRLSIPQMAEQLWQNAWTAFGGAPLDATG